MILKYDSEAIEKALTLLNNIEIKGEANATRVVMIGTILKTPKEEEDGSSSR